ncbi:MAG: hypothetical protein U9M90_02155, partial [Patescibacteria group bacterium]|nr:hypothetical protein [Patescibacteria group bacterium]
MKRSTRTNQKKKPSSSGKNDFSLKDAFLQIVEGFIKNFFEQLQDGIASKAREIIQEAKRSVTITLLIVFGTIFLFVGLANVIDVVIGF